MWRIGKAASPCIAIALYLAGCIYVRVAGAAAESEQITHAELLSFSGFFLKEKPPLPMPRWALLLGFSSGDLPAMRRLRGRGVAGGLQCVRRGLNQLADSSELQLTVRESQSQGFGASLGVPENSRLTKTSLPGA